MTNPEGQRHQQSTAAAAASDEAGSSPDWHALSTEQVLAHLGVSAEGLSSAEAARRLEQYGPNELPHRPPPQVWVILLRQFQNPLIYILIAAALISIAIGHPTDAGFIAVVVVINALIGGFQEHRAERSAQALQQMLRIRAAVERDGDVSEIDAEQVVLGDVIWLESGNRVPADARLLSSHGLEVDESLLTGESTSVSKEPSPVCRPRAAVADRVNMVFAGATVVRGRGKAVVVSTGERTQIGQLALDVLDSPAGKPPLLVRLARFTRMVGIMVIIAAVVVSLLGVLLRGYSVPDMFMFAVALAVSAIPEGLPITITVALAIGATRMARRGVIVRRMAAVEGLGSCGFIASDKTGTLTRNELTVRAVVLRDGTTCEVTGEGFAPTGEVRCEGRALERGENAVMDDLARASVLCNEAELHQHSGSWVWHGDPTDVALLSMAHRIGWVRERTLDENPQLSQIPFEPELRFAASFHDVADKPTVFVKGAPERVLQMCALSPEERSAALQRAEALAETGHRVLAFAQGLVRESLQSEEPPEPQELEFLGFVGMIDPLRVGVREAVEDCAQAGIRVCMVTGDHPVTALAIARDLGFAESPEQVVTGDQLTSLSEEQLRERVAKARVFARVAPGQKLDIVKAAQAAGHFVAVTGDGANDAPALRAANVGVAMGQSGTDVARDSSDLVLSDDNFATIVAGIEEGRIAYDNIRKVVYLLVSTGAAEVMLVMLSVIFGSPLPLLPVQLLWLNLVTNGIQDKALAFEPGEDGVLRRQPRPPRERIFNRLMIENCMVDATIMAVAGFIVFQLLLSAGWAEQEARNALLLLMVLFENVHIGNCRSEVRSALFLSPLRSPLLLVGAISALLVHIAAMYIPFMQSVLQTQPVDLQTWFTLGLVALGFFTLAELHKWTWRLRSPEHIPRRLKQSTRTLKS